MCLAKTNVGERVIGSDNFKKIDPAGAALERFDAKHVAPIFTGKEPDGAQALTATNTPPVEKGPPVDTNDTTLLTGARTVKRATPGPRTTLLGQ